MNATFRKALSLILAIVMCVSLLPVSAFAEVAAEEIAIEEQAETVEIAEPTEELTDVEEPTDATPEEPGESLPTQEPESEEPMPAEEPVQPPHRRNGAGGAAECLRDLRL